MSKCKLKFRKRSGLTYHFDCTLKHDHQSLTTLRMRGFLIADVNSWWGGRQAGTPFQRSFREWDHDNRLYTNDNPPPRPGGFPITGRY